MTAPIAPIPDSALAVAAHALLTDAAPPALVNHSERTYVFGTALLQQLGRRFDAEALYIAALLHDLGLTEKWEDGVTPFEIRGAQVARDELLRHGSPPEFAERVREAIALHLELTAADDPRPELAGVALGAGLDVTGLRLDELPPRLVAEALERYPRLDAKAFLIEATGRQVRLKPDSRVAQYVLRHRFTELIAAAPFAS
jgi:hypothetical protein